MILVFSRSVRGPGTRSRMCGDPVGTGRSFVLVTQSYHFVNRLLLVRNNFSFFPFFFLLHFPFRPTGQVILTNDKGIT